MSRRPLHVEPKFDASVCAGRAIGPTTATSAEPVRRESPLIVIARPCGRVSGWTKTRKQICNPTSNPIDRIADRVAVRVVRSLSLVQKNAPYLSL